MAVPRRSCPASPADPKGELRLVEARLARLEGEVATFSARGRLRPPAPSPAPFRPAPLARWLLAGGVALIAAAIIVAVR
jgi:hypothetical protein